MQRLQGLQRHLNRRHLVLGRVGSWLGPPHHPLAGVAPQWYVLAVELPILLIRVDGAIFGLLGNLIDPALVSSSVTAYIPTLAFLTLIAGLGEEPGQRGFALPLLKIRQVQVAAILFLGLVWALWHLPLVFVDPKFLHGFTFLAPLVLLALLQRQS